MQSAFSARIILHKNSWIIQSFNNHVSINPLFTLVNIFVTHRDTSPHAHTHGLLLLRSPQHDYSTHDE